MAKRHWIFTAENTAGFCESDRCLPLIVVERVSAVFSGAGRSSPMGADYCSRNVMGTTAHVPFLGLRFHFQAGIVFKTRSAS